jgi:calmodulin
VAAAHFVSRSAARLVFLGAACLTEAASHTARAQERCDHSRRTSGGLQALGNGERLPCHESRTREPRRSGSAAAHLSLTAPACCVQDYKEKDIAKMIKKWDVDGSGEIDMNEFLLMMEKRQSKMDFDEELRQAFDFFDTNKNGHISADELKMIMKALGFEINDAELELMISSVDENGDRQINFEEFRRMMTDGPV